MVHKRQHPMGDELQCLAARWKKNSREGAWAKGGANERAPHRTKKKNNSAHGNRLMKCPDFVFHVKLTQDTRSECDGDVCQAVLGICFDAISSCQERMGEGSARLPAALSGDFRARREEKNTKSG